MTDCLPEAFGGYGLVRQWIPKAKPDVLATSRTGKLVKGFTEIVIGDTGWPALTASEAAKDIGQAYGHFLVDDNNIIECVPALTSRVGIVEQARFVETRTSTGELDAHETTLAINLCFGGAVDGPEAYKRCVGLAAFACKRFNLDPNKDVKSAGDLDPARKDPDRALRAAGVDFKDLVRAIAGKLSDASKTELAHA